MQLAVDAVGRQAVEHARVLHAVDANGGGRRRAELGAAHRVPRRGLAERLLRAVADPRGLQARVEDEGLDVPDAAPVGGVGQGDDELAVLGSRADEEEVAGREVEARVDDRVGIARELVRRQGRLRHAAILPLRASGSSQMAR